MKLIGKKQLKEITSLSINHLARLEAVGKFPRRVKLTDAKNGRVAWSLEEVELWCQERLNLRGS